jgi:DNA-binding HxlR family transcriptional regulator
LRNNLFRRADELATSVRGFYNWLTKFLTEAKTQEFTALDLRKAKPLNPRTLNRYLQELKLFSYIQVIGGNKHREGFIYKLTNFGNQNDVQNRIEQDIQTTLKNVWNAYNKEQNGQTPQEPQQKQKAEPEPEPTTEPQQEPEPKKEKQRVRIDDKEKHTLKILLELEAQQPQREYLTTDFTVITGRNPITEARHLKTLWEQGTLNREWKNRQYYYTLAMNNSKTVSQNPMTDTETQQP